MTTSCDAIQNVCGIYLIRNKINNKIYIGQSVNIKRRWLEHLRSGQPEKYPIKSQRDMNVPIHKSMQKYGIDNFDITVLEICEQEQLNDKEKYWIKILSSNDKNIGYNIGEGGQDNFALKGENHSQAKLSQTEVDQIVDLLKNSNLSLAEINKKFPQVTKSTLSMINNGKTWKQDNLNYPLRVLSPGKKGQKNSRAKLTDQEVMEIRMLQSQGVTQSKLPQKYKEKVGKSSISNIYLGKTFQHLPIWDAKNKQWIEPCIDYPPGSNN